ncbi:hypothetical protein F0T03_19440 [Yersinia canariae]|uniref:Uncharacterized protein n=1 Tax=Yersinia canariae TaxID=2607663 RepID=A0A857F3Q2_9GAMM|nr:hypothetical protein [Yersinia canariae]QHB34118.1 hypothetical protein F0T03_19440 [Yersinia canariae]
MAAGCLLAVYFVDHQSGHFQQNDDVWQNPSSFSSYLPANCGELYSRGISLQGGKAAFFMISKRLLSMF